MAKSNPKSSPLSFYKIILDQSASNLRLPYEFVKRLHLEGKFPQNPVLKIQTGQKWRVEIERSGERACFGKGWLDFVKDTQIQVGDFLVFTLIANSNFQVYIFDPNGCLKDLTFATSTNCKCSCSCSRCRITGDDSKNAINIEEEYDDGNIIVEEHDDDHEFDEESDIELRPCFEKVLTAFNGSYVELPKQFVLESGLGNGWNTFLRNTAGREWPVTVKTRNRCHRAYISRGWPRFRTENKLMDGDTCLFQYFHGDQEGSQSGFILVEVAKEVARKWRRPPQICKDKRSRIIDADLKNAIKLEEEDDGDTNAEVLDDNDDDDHEVDDKNNVELQPFGRKDKTVKLCFQKVLTRTNAYYVGLPRWFVFQSGLKNERRTILRNKAGRDWPVTLKTWDGRVFISRGWVHFRRVNMLMDGDTCSFQYFHGDYEGSQSSFIQVEVIKKAAKNSGRAP